MALQQAAWPIQQQDSQHRERVALLRLIEYETMVRDPLVPSDGPSSVMGLALSLNISSRGMLVLMDREPLRDQVLRVSVPSAAGTVSAPTLADVRWTRTVPLINDRAAPLYFVGLRFLF